MNLCRAALDTHGGWPWKITVGFMFVATLVFAGWAIGLSVGWWS